MNMSRILPTLQSSLVCEEIRQEVTGHFILIGVINVIVVPQLPVNAVLCTFNRWTAGVGDFRETVRVLAPDQKTVLAKTDVRFNLDNPHRQTNNGSRFMLKIEAAGIYFVEVLVDDILKLRYPLPVALAQQQQQAGGPPPSTATA